MGNANQEIGEGDEKTKIPQKKNKQATIRIL